MSTLTADLRRLFVRELDCLAREIDLFPDDELVWKTLPGVTNSAANLALHVSGNLQHFVGAVLGRTGYVRDRDAEFGRRTGTRAELTQELRTTIGVIDQVLPAIDEDALSREYPEPVAGCRLRTDLFLMHLAVHLGLHLGQAGYLRRVLTGDGRSTGPVAVKALAG